VSLRILTECAFIPTRSTYALRRAESFRLCECRFQLNTTPAGLPNLLTTLADAAFVRFMKVVMRGFLKSCHIYLFFQRRTGSFLLT